jgi:hypothetical protein
MRKLKDSQNAASRSKGHPGSRFSIILIGAFVLVYGGFLSPAGAVDGLRGKLIVGYQGWFGCPGDFAGNVHWQHWFFNDVPTADNLQVDLLPSTGRFSQADLFKTRMLLPNGAPVFLFSAQNKLIVEAHFQWMKNYAIDGAAIQRFVGPLANPEQKLRSDHVILNAKAGSEAAGRVFYICYDVSGANPKTVTAYIRKDWQTLVRDLEITSSPSYLFEGGKPVLQIWGFGFKDRPGAPHEVANLIYDLKNGLHGLRAASLIGGVPTHWRTLRGDSKTDPAWASVYRSYDVISPWSVGRFADDAGVDNFVRLHILPDIEETKRIGIGYMPVIFPGFSWYNLQNVRGHKKNAILNQVPRRCGDFLWHQVYDLLGSGVETIYAAMFDEVDEGTALFPIENNLPAGSHVVSMDQDGCALPDDWYLQITGWAARYLRSHKDPPKLLNQVLKDVSP